MRFCPDVWYTVPMKVFAISDLHLSINNPKPMDIFGERWDNYLEKISESWENCVSEDDTVLIAGDISWAMTLESAVPDLKYIGGFKGKKVILRGNHDYWWKSISGVRAMLPAGMFAVQNDCVRVDDLLLCGSRGWLSPDVKQFTAEDKKIYDRELIRTRMSLDAMRAERRDGDRVVAMMHYPPFNSRLERSPFTELFTEYEVDAVVYGHLHGKDCRVSRETVIDGIKYYLTSCDLVDNRLVEIELQ